MVRCERRAAIRSGIRGLLPCEKTFISRCGSQFGGAIADIRMIISRWISEVYRCGMSIE